MPAEASADDPEAQPASSARARPVDVAVVRPLRMEVLRPGRPPDASVYPGDDHPLSCHVAVHLDTDLVAIGTVFPEASPWVPDRLDAWRIRGMATRDGLRGRGLGRLVLNVLIDHATANGGGFIWCEARIGAPRFYARSGFVLEGEPFIVEGIEHVHMWRDL